MTLSPDELARLSSIPAMSPPSLLERLHDVGTGWTGQGVAVECGCWLGATCAAMAVGLAKAGYDRPIYCYDRWEADEDEATKASRYELVLKPGDDLEPVFTRFVEPFYPNLITVRGGIQSAKWSGDPIEIFLLDTAKRDPNFSHVMRTFGPSWIPGVTVIGLLDFYYYRYKEASANKRRKYRVHERFAEKYTDHLERVGEDVTCVFFRYTRPIPWETVGETSFKEKLTSLFSRG